MDSIFITCPPAFEEILFQELKSLKIPDLNRGHLGVFARKTMDVVYKVNYASRVATRVFDPLLLFKVDGKESLYQASFNLPWERFIKEGKTFAIDVNVTHPQFKNSLYAAQVMKDGICDALRKKRGSRPSIDVKTPDVQLHLYIHQGRGIISFDTSKDPLFKRGWRQESAPASIQENLAAGLLLHAGYEGGPFCDPMAGSGTFLMEAALIATKTPPGFLRKTWGFFEHPDFDEKSFLKVKQEEDQKRISLPQGIIQGADRDLGMLEMMKRHFSLFDFGNQITLEQRSVTYYEPKGLDLIVSNPPFGKRLELDHKLFHDLGKFLTKAPFRGAYFLATHAKYLEMTGLPFTKTLTFLHGGLEIHVFRINGNNPAYSSPCGSKTL